MVSPSFLNAKTALSDGLYGKTEMSTGRLTHYYYIALKRFWAVDFAVLIILFSQICGYQPSVRTDIVVFAMWIKRIEAQLPVNHAPRVLIVADSREH